jgi:NodT family efflux transporter outer membrane factor (OMF) lipoprotein
MDTGLFSHLKGSNLKVPTVTPFHIIALTNIKSWHVPEQRLFALLYRVGAVLFLAAIASCAPKPTGIEPPIEEPPTFSRTGTELIPDRWWMAFEDPALNTLVDSALARNLDLAATWQQFLAAEAVVRREGADRWPQTDVQIQNAFRFPEPDFAGGENVQLGIGASYEVDLWGRIRSAVQAEKLRAGASLADYRTAAISLSAEIALTWYRLQAARKQLLLAQDQIGTNENIVKLIRARFGSGQVRAVDILRQTQLLETTRNQKIAFETNVALLEHQLAVLLGRAPQNELALDSIAFPTLPPMPETGLPLDLVRRRPDVRQAYLQLLAADRDWASAVRSKYPRLTIDMSAQLRANDFQSLLDNWAYNVAGNLLAPIFYGGRLSAEADRNEAVKQQQLYNYGQTVLIAFREVEDALIREQKQNERLVVMEKQLALAQSTNRQLRTEFINGLSVYLDVLLGLDQEQQLRRDYIDAQLEQLEIRIALYRALAGGFETPDMEALDEYPSGRIAEGK